MSKKITITSISADVDISDISDFLETLPRVDPLFDLDIVKSTFERLRIDADGEPCGLCLYKVFEVDGKLIFYVGALGIDAQKSGGAIGGDVYNWLTAEAEKLGCDWFCCDSIRRGMLDFSRQNDWSVVNVRYAVKLKGQN